MHNNGSAGTGAAVLSHIVAAYVHFVLSWPGLLFDLP